jgi:hypothetical protein
MTQYPVIPSVEDAGQSAATPQPAPTGPVHHDDLVTDAVVVDLLARSDFGFRKYGRRLHINNGRDSLMDAYQEALDLCCYLKQAIMERDRV